MTETKSKRKRAPRRPRAKTETAKAEPVLVTEQADVPRLEKEAEATTEWGAVADRPAGEPDPATVPPLTAERRDHEDDRRRHGGGWPISTALSVGFGVLVAVAVIVVLLLGLYGGREASFALIRDKTELILTSIDDGIESHLRPAWQQAAIVAETLGNGDIPTDDALRLSDFMIASLSGTPQVSAMMFLNTDLESVRIHRDVDGFEVQASHFDEPGIEAALEEVGRHSEPFWGEIVWSPELDQSLINLRAPVKRDGVFVGALFSVITTSDFSAFLADYDDDRTVNVFILYGDDKVLAHPAMIGNALKGTQENPLPYLAEVGDPILNQTWLGERPRALPGLTGDIEGYEVSLAGDDYAVLYKDIDWYGDVPWRIGATVRIEDLAAGLERLVNAAIAGAGVLVIALILSFLLGRGMARPVSKLASAAREVGDLDFDQVPPIRGGGFRETRDAANAFNSMLAGLRAFSIYVPRSLVLRLVQQGDVAHLESEEREVTVLFTDIVGFTSQAEGLAPNETANFLNEHFTLLTEAIEIDRGTVDKYIGDSVMAFWGAPERQPDQAKLACRTALAMADSIDRDNERRLSAGKLPVRIRIGIHTGPAIVGNVGGPTRVDYTLVGDTVNTASRLVDLARNYMSPDDTVTILVSADTAAGLDGSFIVEELGEEGIRGRHGRLGLHKLVGRRGR